MDFSFNLPVRIISGVGCIQQHADLFQLGQTAFIVTGQSGAAKSGALADVLAGFLWVTIFIWGGYLFGNVPLIKENFGIVTILIVVVSVLPVRTLNSMSFAAEAPPHTGAG